MFLFCFSGLTHTNADLHNKSQSDNQGVSVLDNSLQSKSIKSEQLSQPVLEPLESDRACLWSAGCCESEQCTEEHYQKQTTDRSHIRCRESPEKVEELTQWIPQPLECDSIGHLLSAEGHNQELQQAEVTEDAQRVQKRMKSLRSGFHSLLNVTVLDVFGLQMAIIKNKQQT